MLLKAGPQNYRPNNLTVKAPTSPEQNLGICLSMDVTHVKRGLGIALTCIARDPWLIEWLVLFRSGANRAPRHLVATDCQFDNSNR